jgi:prevent-host-death family protein
MSQFNIHVVKAHLSELIQRAMMGEEIIIAKDNKPVAKLTALKLEIHKRKVGSAKGLIKIAADFDEELDDFKDYSE